MKGLKISLWVDYEDKEIDVTYSDLGISESDFKNLTNNQKCQAVNEYVAKMKDQPKWSIDDFFYFTSELQSDK